MYLSRQLRETLSAVTSIWSQTYCNMIAVHCNIVAVLKNHILVAVLRKDCDYGSSSHKNTAT